LLFTGRLPLAGVSFLLWLCLKTAAISTYHPAVFGAVQDMKKQINQKIKAHLVRSAPYILLLLAIARSRLAWASDSNASNQSASNSVLPQLRAVTNHDLRTSRVTKATADPHFGKI
jgi:hypothetical protein